MYTAAAVVPKLCAGNDWAAMTVVFNTGSAPARSRGSFSSDDCKVGRQFGHPPSSVRSHLVISIPRSEPGLELQEVQHELLNELLQHVVQPGTKCGGLPLQQRHPDYCSATERGIRYMYIQSTMDFGVNEAQ